MFAFCEHFRCPGLLQNVGSKLRFPPSPDQLNIIGLEWEILRTHPDVSGINEQNRRSFQTLQKWKFPQREMEHSITVVHLVLVWMERFTLLSCPLGVNKILITLVFLPNSLVDIADIWCWIYPSLRPLFLMNTTLKEAESLAEIVWLSDEWQHLRNTRFTSIA